MTRKEAENIIDEAVARIGEHFDAVQVLASFNENAATTCVNRGAGNWYARQGMAHEFIQKDIAQEQAFALANQMQKGGEE